MILKQFYLNCLSQASYLIADPGTGNAAVVDPRRDVDLYLEEARALGVKIRFILLTHVHADFVAGHHELEERTGATVCLGARAAVDFPFRGLADGESLHLGGVRIEVLETPGHTPESVCFLVHPDGAGEMPALLSGDTLFLGDVGRPDLMASAGLTPEELAGLLYRSLRAKILPLPDETLVYPGHGAGSACGKNLSSDTVSSLGQQRRINYALQAMSEAEFVRLVTADQPAAPAYFAHAAAVNRGRRELLPTVLARSLKPLSLDDVVRMQRDGVQVLDTRSAAAFAAEHLPGSVNVGLNGRYASWAGTVMRLDRPVVLVTEEGSEEESALRLGRVGIDSVQGYLSGGAGAWRDRPEVVARTPRLSPEALKAELDGSSVCVVDVRTPAEYEQGAIPGSLAIPLSDLPRRQEEIPRDSRVVFCCQSGYRSMVAASMLEGAGHRDLADLDGGMQAWFRSFGPGLAPSCESGTK